MPDLKLLAIVQELRDRAEEALAKAETFHIKSKVFPKSG